MVSAPTLLGDELAHFQARLIADALNEAEAAYWRRRAQVLRWAQPRPGEFHGRATREELRESWHRLEEQAQACEHRARVAAAKGGEVR